jgi:hypothetical protein
MTFSGFQPDDAFCGFIQEDRNAFALSDNGADQCQERLSV